MAVGMPFRLHNITHFSFCKEFLRKNSNNFCFPLLPRFRIAKSGKEYPHWNEKVFRFLLLWFALIRFVRFICLFVVRFVAFRCFWSHFHRFVIIQCRVLNLSAIFTILKIFDNSLVFFALFAYFRVKNS